MNPDQTTLIQQSNANDLCQGIESIKSALGEKVTQKKLLKEKAIIAKNQIQDDISFHLELLRNREVWLLEQVDIHAQIKEESFESHINELSALLAKLEAYQELLEASELKETEMIAMAAMEIISGLKDEVLNAEEALGICFSADNFALSDALKNFGNIEEGEPAQKKPRVHKKKSTSRDNSYEVFIQEHFKRVLNSPQKDWLIAGSESKESRKDLGIVFKFYEELQKSDSKEWLYRKCQPMDLETLSNRFNDHFQQVKATPTTDWLQSGIVTDVGQNSPEGYTTMDTSENIRGLLRPLEGLSLSSNGVEMLDEGISMTRHCVEGKNPCIGEKYIDGKNEWLLKEKSIEDVSPDDQLGGYMSNQPQEAKMGSWLQRFRESTGSNTSDWLIVSEGEAEPDNCEWLTQESIDCCKRCPGDSGCPRETFNVFRNVLNSPKSEWLATAADW